MIPTGLCFLSFSEKSWPYVMAAKLPRYYWDIRAEDKTNKNGETHFSSSVTLIRALRVALKMMLAEGIERQILKALGN
jgi:aspartate aminotransferase-like enzyme